jgi:glycosyltransferase involved in cell wall biosynthesis
MNTSPYILITPARNEEAFIGATIASVVAQTVRPAKWMIVNDASTDRTGEIIESFAATHGFIKAITLKRDGGRDFGKKALAFRRALEEVKDLPYEFIGNLDADVTLEPDYYEKILGRFAADPSLGIAGGTVYLKIGGIIQTADGTPDSVGGQMQMFRRPCFEAVGGYLPLKLGGIDAAAEIIARMKGWKVAKFPDCPVREHRVTGTASVGLLHAKVQWGRRFHSLGYHPLFYFSRCVYRIGSPPLIIGSMAELFGFFSSLIRRHPHSLPVPVVEYLRREQKEKLRNLVFRRRATQTRV